MAALNPALAFISGAKAAGDLEEVDEIAADAAKTAGSKVRERFHVPTWDMVKLVALALCGFCRCAGQYACVYV